MKALLDDGICLIGGAWNMNPEKDMSVMPASTEVNHGEAATEVFDICLKRGDDWDCVPVASLLKRPDTINSDIMLMISANLLELMFTGASYRLAAIGYDGAPEYYPMDSLFLGADHIPEAAQGTFWSKTFAVAAIPFRCPGTRCARHTRSGEYQVIFASFDAPHCMKCLINSLRSSARTVIICSIFVDITGALSWMCLHCYQGRDRQSDREA